MAVLCTADTDMIPAVSRVRGTGGVKIINVTWPHLGKRLARTCGKWIMMQGALIDELAQK